jgi:hypothetical protein
MHARMCRHDLKIYSSDEGRVQTSAAAFTQGLLDLEGDSLTPILVRCAASNQKGWKISSVRACIMSPCSLCSAGLSAFSPIH